MSPEEVVCKLECQDLVSRYFRFLDRGPRSDIGQIFTEDAKMGASGDFNGIHPTQAFSTLPAEFTPTHLATNILITPTGPDTATGEAYCVAYNTFGSPDDVLPRKMPDHPNRIGVVLFKFGKTPDGWRIAEFDVETAAYDDGAT